MRRIYLDTAAATPLDKRVSAKMAEFFRRARLPDGQGFGNPSSIHAEGVAARRAVETARREVADILKAAAGEIIFTSGGTESNNLALNGRRHIVTTAIEHSSILEPARRASKLTVVPVRAGGLVDPAALGAAIRPETDLVSVHYANNEIGVIQPIREIAKMIRHFRKSRNLEAGRPSSLYFHVDACQAPRFLDLNVARLGVDLLTLNGGKIYGPKGSGCLYVRRGVKLTPLQLGGGQENGRRSGTKNVPAIVGFAAALRLAAAWREKESGRLSILRDYFIDRLLKFEGIKLNGPRQNRLPNNINISIEGVEAEQLVLELDARGIACSAGSACSSNIKEESYVIMNAVRFTLGRETTKKDIDYILRVLPPIINKLRSYKL